MNKKNVKNSAGAVMKKMLKKLPKGKKKRPLFRASDVAHVQHALKAIKSRVKKMRTRAELFTPKRLSIKDQAFFAKRLSFLITSGVPIMESLNMLHAQARSGMLSRVIDVVVKDVANGQTLSKSLARFPDMFGQFSINLIKVGESSGTLSENLDYLADELKKKHALQRMIVGALIYPALVTVATLGITIFLMVYLFPKIMPVFMSMRMQLPLSTRIVIAISTFLQHFGILLLVVFVAAGIGFGVALKRNASFRGRVERCMLRVPLIGNMTRSYQLANFTRTLGLLLASATPLSQSLTITADTTAHAVYRTHAHALTGVVSRGQAISTYFDLNRTDFGDVLCHMVAVGERSGNVPNTLIYLSEFYERELDDMTKGLSSLIEPALMICMGLLIGFIAISIITPIYAITQSLHP